MRGSRSVQGDHDGPCENCRTALDRIKAGEPSACCGSYERTCKPGCENAAEPGPIYQRLYAFLALRVEGDILDPYADGPHAEDFGDG